MVTSNNKKYSYPKSVIQAPLLVTGINLFYKNPISDFNFNSITKLISEINSFENSSLLLSNILKLIFKNLDKDLILFFNQNADKNYLNYFLSDFNFFLDNIYFGDLIYLYLSFLIDVIKLGNQNILGLKYKCAKCESEFEYIITLNDFLENKGFLIFNPCSTPFCFKNFNKEYKLIKNNKNGKSISLIFYLPSIREILFSQYYYNSDENSDLFDEYILLNHFIKKIEINNGEKIISDKKIIFNFIKNIPTKIYEKLFLFFKENFLNKLIPNLTIKKQCPECGFEFNSEIKFSNIFSKEFLIENLNNLLENKIQMFIQMYFYSKLNFSGLEDFLNAPPHLLEEIISQAEEYIKKEKSEYEKIIQMIKKYK